MLGLTIVDFIQLHYMIVAIGGIMSTQNKLNAGTNLTLVYTSLIYKDPRLVASCAQTRFFLPIRTPETTMPRLGFAVLELFVLFLLVFLFAVTKE